jgi:hypothetical protein
MPIGVIENPDIGKIHLIKIAVSKTCLLNSSFETAVFLSKEPNC